MLSTLYSKISYYLNLIQNTLSHYFYSNKNTFAQLYLHNQNYYNSDSHYFKDIYLLYIYIHPEVSQDIKDKYIEKTQNKIKFPYFWTLIISYY